MVPRQTQPAPNNSLLVFLVAALFMITLTLIGIFYLDAGTSLSKIKSTQNKNSQISHTQQQDLTKITCSMWHTMTTAPDVHPSPEIKQQMTTLCG